MVNVLGVLDACVIALAFVSTIHWIIEMGQDAAVQRGRR